MVFAAAKPKGPRITGGDPVAGSKPKPFRLLAALRLLRPRIPSGGVIAVDYEQQVLTVQDDDLATWQVNYDAAAGTGSASGPCPRCQHETQTTIATEASVREAFAKAEVKNLNSLTRLVDRACTQAHASRPAGIDQGCGGEWLISVVTQDAGFKAKAGDLALLGSARAFREASKTELSTVRGIAEKWVQGVAALLGLFSIAGLVFATDAVDDLSTGYQQFFACLAAGALLAAAVGTYFAYKAAFGWPRSRSVRDDAQLQEFFSEQQTRARKAARKLSLGVGSTFLSLAALGAAFDGDEFSQLGPACTSIDQPHSRGTT